MSPALRIARALDLARRYGGIDGDHHKTWVIDQMVRVLTGCPTTTETAIDVHATPYKYELIGESAEYRAFVAAAKAGEDGPETYGWEIGIPP